MDPNNSVLDISSDEEPDVNHQKSNLEWLCEQLFQDVDDSDDVVVVREVLNFKQAENKCLNSTVAASNTDEKKVQEEEEDDDDCVVLEGDPDKFVAVEDNQENGSDELVVVGEKGQVACRDYPHPRHLCVKYPFSSSLHKYHCEQCHCYVCDTVAPCDLWGTGMSTVDHCHATEKQEVWKTERKNFKLKRCSSFPVIKMSESTSLMVPSPVSTQKRNQRRHLARSTTMPRNYDSLHSMPSLRAVCSMPSVPPVSSMPSVPAVRSMPSVPADSPVPSATNSGGPNIINPRSGLNRIPPSSISQQWPGGHTSISQKVKYQNAPNMGSQPAGFKRVKTSLTYRPAYHAGYGQPQTSIRSYVPSTPHNQPLCGDTNKRDSHLHPLINPGPNVNAGASHNPVQRSHFVSTLHTPTTYQYVTPNEPITEIMGTQQLDQHGTYLSNMPGSLPTLDSAISISTQWTLPLQAEFASGPNVSDPWADGTNSKTGQLDDLSQTQVASIPNVYSPWVDNSTQLNQTLHPEASGYQGLQSVNAASSHHLPREHWEKGPVSDNQASGVPELENLRFEFEDWPMENQATVNNMNEPALFSEQNILSPDDAHIDSVLLYDDEWNVMTSMADI